MYGSSVAHYSNQGLSVLHYSRSDLEPYCRTVLSSLSLVLLPLILACPRRVRIFQHGQLHEYWRTHNCLPKDGSHTRPES